MKVMRTMSIDSELNKKLKTESNATALIEYLLTEHYKGNMGKLNDKASELNLQLEAVEGAKEKIATEDDKMRKLKEIGIIDSNLINILRNRKESPGVESVRRMKINYNIQEATTIWKAWRILHDEE